MDKFMRRAGVILLLATSLVGKADASVVTYYGIDPGVGPGGAHPVSAGVAANFDAAAASLGTTGLITFEGQATGYFASKSVAPGVTLSLLNANDPAYGDGGIQNSGGTVIVGYNTTAGGSEFLRIRPVDSSTVTTASATFSFATPIQAFGSYLTGLGTANGKLSVDFSDGTNQDISVAGNANGGILFFGFTDAGKSISSVTLSLNSATGNLADAVGIDDVRYTSAAVPEPSTAALAGLGLVSVALLKWRKRSRARNAA